MSSSQQIIESWQANAHNWIATIDHNEIESRKLATNKAIEDCVVAYAPKKILDIGCGEGWLTRALRNKGLDAYGVDAIQSLVDNAVVKGGPFYRRASYRELFDEGTERHGLFDAAVINFALIDQEDTNYLLQHLQSLLRQPGMVFIQTLHPFNVKDGAYITGWREGSWDGLKRPFEKPYQWYFRTMGEWVRLFSKCGFSIIEMREPLHPATTQPLSVIFVLRPQLKSFQ